MLMKISRFSSLSSRLSLSALAVLLLAIWTLAFFVNSTVQEDIQRTLIATFLLSILASGVTFLIIRRQLKPMLEATKTLEQLPTNGAFPPVLPVAKSDEVGALIGGFNRLLLSLAQREDALRSSEESLRTNERDLQMALKEKTSLLNEVHHRVKNNLQVITSLLRLEAGRSDQANTKAVLNEMEGRIRSMALLHETLYRSGIFASVDLTLYLRELAIQAFRALASDGAAIELKLDLAAVTVSMDKATPCGLMVNELISNCLKHGFPDGRSGEVLLVLKLIEGTNQVLLSVSDNGIGLPLDFASKRETSLGLQLASDLAKQIGGALEIQTGSVFRVVFPVTE